MLLAFMAGSDSPHQARKRTLSFHTFRVSSIARRGAMQRDLSPAEDSLWALGRDVSARHERAPAAALVNGSSRTPYNFGGNFSVNSQC